MLAYIAELPAFWGFMGAFIYAAPRFSACYWQCRDTQSGWGRCLFDAVVALCVGSIAAFALAEWTKAILNRTGDYELRAISALIGLLANRLAPKVVDKAEDFLANTKWTGTKK